MWTPESLAIIAVTFLLAGSVKGVIGLGLPTVSLAILAATLGLKEAMALMLIPAFAANFWQGLAGDALIMILRRFWTLLVGACIGVWLGTGILVAADAALLKALLGVLLVVYSLISLTGWKMPLLEDRERWASPGIGFVGGILMGMTGSYVVPGALYLQALGLGREVLLQAMGVTFSTATIAFAVALGGHDVLTPDLAALSAIALVPTALGMLLGRAVRRRLSEILFTKVFFSGLLIIGTYIILRAAV
jgi:hypothetical protein